MSTSTNKFNKKKEQKPKSVKFLLTPRPQRDPLAADFEAPQHVLVPKGGLKVEQVQEKFPGLDSSLFASKDETKVGMLERAHLANGMTFDSDVLQAMSKDFDYDDPQNILDDDFIDQAGGLIEDEGEMLEGEMTDLARELFEDDPEVVDFNEYNQGEDKEESEDQDSDNYDLDEDIRDYMNDDDLVEGSASGYQGNKLILFKKKSSRKGAERLRKQELDADESIRDDESGTKTIFTNYSMTSSIVRRTQGLKQIDEHFERLYEQEYADDTEIGPLDLNDVKGDELLTNIDQIREMKKEVKIARKRNHGDDYEPEIVSDHHKNAIIGSEPAAEDEDLVEVEFNKRENRIDCESILSYNSNIYNHPRLIVEPGRRRRQTSQTDKMDTNDDSDARSRSEISQSIASTRASILSKLSIRPANETSEDRRARKKALKIYRQERRKERKQNQEIFKDEKANVMRQQRLNRPALRLA